MIRGGNKNGVGKDYELCFFKALCCIISFSKDSFVVDVAVVAIVFCIVEEKFHRIIKKKRKWFTEKSSLHLRDSEWPRHPHMGIPGVNNPVSPSISKIQLYMILV